MCGWWICNVLGAADGHWQKKECNVRDGHFLSPLTRLRMQSMAHGRVGGELRLWRLTHHSVSKNVYARHVRDSVASAIRDEGASGQSTSVEKCGTSGANALSDELAGGMHFLIAERRQTAL